MKVFCHPNGAPWRGPIVTTDPYQPVLMEFTMMTKTFEPVRPLPAPDDGSPYFHKAVFGDLVVHYGQVHWPSRSYWLVPVSVPDM